MRNSGSEPTFHHQITADDTTLAGFEAGIEWLVDAGGCDPQRLANLGCLQQVCADLIQALKLNVVTEPQWHQFPPADGSDQGGVTGLYLLSESHLACHTFPERCWATFNLYCCRRRPDWPWQE